MTTHHLKAVQDSGDKEEVPLTLKPKDRRDLSGKEQRSVNLPKWQWERLDAIAAANGYSRNELMTEMLRAEIDAQDGTKPDDGPAPAANAPKAEKSARAAK